MFVLIFANFRSRKLSCDLSGDHMVPHAELCIRAQASHGNVSVLSHFNIDASLLSGQKMQWLVMYWSLLNLWGLRLLLMHISGWRM